MKITATAIPDVLLFEPTVHGDSRGYFMETFRKTHFTERGITLDFVQDNQSLSSQGTLRGLHYQLKHPQGKLVRAGSGSLFDVAVDMRRSSPTFGRWVGVELSAENKRQLWVPPGFAHGFYVTSQSAELIYKCTDYYDASDDQSLLWNDETIGIDWPLVGSTPLLSAKDEAGKRFEDAPTYE
ncbi:MAG: dTDP-4-dehydrorhamnose 3,5-epimerase [Proteobacteria bacterium]|nr:dTDP-4-dehydrorhamnose 3,5-epimerase [Pseudomonadota bacterium]MDA0897447.1 dTDP-4-dehydrorhamnose 3,5-epimerase [Pseudomonadota bacterium]MDA1245361.1 dTDP-4-dehydrorhamnose 3,5-epimerase [Pseudomonadota bacterium]